ncbi:MAG: hypothetical protein ABUL62_26080 [Myxococcales bacterium]
MSDPPEPRRGSRPYLPPPPETRDDSPESFDVPRMEPPPPSLEALVRKRPGAPLAPAKGSQWVWIGLLIVTIGAAMYYLGLRQ